MLPPTLRPLTLCVLLFITSATTLADPLTTRPADSRDLQSWWGDLQQSEPQASRALLNFSAHPAEAVPFLAKQLRPLKLEPDELNLLLSFLASDKPAEWKPAFEQLEYLDPRLAMDLKPLMDSVPDNPARSRLVEILCDYPPDTYKGKMIKLNQNGSGKEIYYNFFDGHGSWWAEPKIERLGSNSWSNGKKKWQRAVRAIVLLKHINTRESLAIIKEMSTGHPDALPTKVAKEALAEK